MRAAKQTLFSVHMCMYLYIRVCMRKLCAFVCEFLSMFIYVFLSAYDMRIKCAVPPLCYDFRSQALPAWGLMVEVIDG